MACLRSLSCKVVSFVGWFSVLLSRHFPSLSFEPGVAPEELLVAQPSCVSLCIHLFRRRSLRSQVVEEAPGTQAR